VAQFESSSATADRVFQRQHHPEIDRYPVCPLPFPRRRFLHRPRYSGGECAGCPRCHRREFPSSKRARNSASWLRSPERDLKLLDRNWHWSAPAQQSTTSNVPLVIAVPRVPGVVNRLKSPRTGRVPLDLFSRVVPDDDVLAVPSSGAQEQRSGSSANGGGTAQSHVCITAIANRM
jgi:hypothetical protein